MKVTAILALTVPLAMAQKKEEEVSVGDWLLQHIILILGLTVLALVLLWCCCSVHASHAEKRAQELRRQYRQEQEEEELHIQTNLYNQQEDQQRKILQILQKRLTEKRNQQLKDGNAAINLPNYVNENQDVSAMQREELEAEFAKITPDQIEQLDQRSKEDIKAAQDIIA